MVIEAAINGVTSKEQNPNLPRLPTEIAEDSLRCLAAGATIVHNHVDVALVDGETAAARYLEGWRPVWKAVPDALLYPTVNAGPVEMSFAHFPILASAGCRIGVVDAGSVNLGGFVYVNSRTDIEFQLDVCARHHLGPSLAIFEPGFLRTVLGLWHARRLPAGSMVKLYFGGEDGYLGGVFGLPPTKPSFEAYLSMLEGIGLPWSAAVIGGDIVGSGIARMAVEHGGHLHVGLEDWSGPGCPTNDELVRAGVAVCQEVGRPVASPVDTVEILGLPSRGVGVGDANG